MCTEWLVTTILIYGVGIGLLVFLTVRKHVYYAQIADLVMMFYGGLALLLWGMEAKFFLCASTPSAPLPDVSHTLKHVLFACAGGLLARSVIWADRLVSGRLVGNTIAPLLDGVLGVFTGLFALGLLITAYLATGKEPAENRDIVAGLAGVAGGSLGVGTLALVKTWFRKFAGTGESRE